MSGHNPEHQSNPWMWIAFISSASALFLLVVNTVLITLIITQANELPEKSHHKPVEISEQPEPSLPKKIRESSKSTLTAPSQLIPDTKIEPQEKFKNATKEETLGKNKELSTKEAEINEAVENQGWSIPKSPAIDAFLSKNEMLVIPPRLSYQWKEGAEYAYKFSMKMKGKSSKHDLSGVCTYKVGPERYYHSFTDFELHTEETTGNGSGFVVDPNGYLVTCAHVVENAKKIEVKVNGKKYPAKIVAFHNEEDLAILQIQAKDLPTVPLTNSDKVEVAEDVRIMGYPLGSILGREVKTVKGVISGILNFHNQDRFQLDAAINPGNSGGPTFNTRGEVIGVNDSKLIEEDVSNISFAIPSKVVEEFLIRNNIRFQKTSQKTSISATSHFEKASPAIAYIDVVFNKNFKSKSIEVSHESTYRNNVQHIMPTLNLSQGTLTRDREFMTLIPSTPKSVKGKLLTSPQGEIHDFKGAHWFDMINRPLGKIALERLPNRDQNSWKVEKIFEKESMYRRPNKYISSSTYWITSESPEKVTIEKSCKLRSLDHPTQPYKRFSTDETIIFNKTLGVIESCKSSGFIIENDRGKPLRIPIEMSYELITKKELKAFHDKVAIDLKIALEEKAIRDAPMKLTPKLKESFLSGLKSNNHRKVYETLRTLSKKGPIKPDDEVSKAVFELLDHYDSSVRYAAKDSIKKWAAPGSVDSMTELLEKSRNDSSKSSLRNALIEGLAVTGSTKAIKPVVESLTTTLNSYDAKKALTVIGSPAEIEVAKLLIIENENHVHTICDVLSQIGTKKCIPLLKEAKELPFSSYRVSSIQSAITAIEKRLKVDKAKVDEKQKSR